MEMIDICQAKSSLSKLVEAIERGQEREIFITRDGRPVARLVPMNTGPTGKRLGVAKGVFEVPDYIDTLYSDTVIKV